MYDHDRQKSEDDLREATRVMVEERIPQLAKELNELGPIMNFELSACRSFDQEAKTFEKLNIVTR